MSTAESTEAIQLFRPNYRVEECLQEIRETLESGWTGLGFKTLEIEKRWTETFHLSHAHFLNSATAALHLALQVQRDHYRWPTSAEVITSPLTFVSTNHAILKAGLNPVFADVDEYLCLSPESVESHIGPNTKAVMFVGLGGSTGQLEEVATLCRRNNLSLILDAAHMAGTRLNGTDPAHLANVACYSFQSVKNLPTADSGMVCFSDGELDALARKYSWLGIDRDTYARSLSGTYAWRYEVNALGDKYHGNSVMAALALVGLKYLEEDNQQRRKYADIYQERLANLPGVHVVPNPPNCESSRHLFQIRVDDRESLMKYLHRESIYPGVHYRLSTDYSIYSGFSHDLPNAETAATQIVSLPMHVNLEPEDIDRVTSAIEAWSRQE